MSSKGPRERVPARLAATIGLSCGALIALIWLFGGFKAADLRLHDLRYQMRGPIAASDRVAMVEVDDLTLHYFKDVWPLPRENYAIAIDAILGMGGAQALGIDLLFLGENQDNPGADQLLAAVAGQYPNLVLGINFQPTDATLGGTVSIPVDSSALIRHARPVSRQKLATARGISVPYDDLLLNAKELGSVAVLIDADGIIRRIPQFVRFGDWAYPSLVLRLVEVAARGDSTLPQFELDPNGTRIYWHGRNLKVPADEEGATSIAFAGAQASFKHRYSLLQVLQWYGDEHTPPDTVALAKAFRGKLVLMGTTAVQQNATDIGPTPYSSAAPLVYVHANAVNAALNGRFLWHVPTFWLAFLLVVLGLGIGLMCWWLPISRAGMVTGGVLLAIAGLDYGLFVFADADIPPTAALIVPVLTIAVVEIFWRNAAEQRAKLRAKELDVARTIQQNLLPAEAPKVAGLEVYGRNIPADEIGGDYFDWLELEDGSLAVVVGDVSGHGIPAALLMAFLRASFHATASVERAPEDIVSSMNKSLSRAATPGKFATFFLGIISPKEQKLKFCNGGHNSPYVLHNGALKELPATGIPLAITEFGPYSGGEEPFGVGDTLVIFSDGIPEARVGKDFYGDERLQKKALDLYGLGVDSHDFAEKILVDVKAIAGEGMKADDVTIVVVRATGNAGPTLKS